MKKILLIMFAMILITTVGAETFTQNEEIDIKVICINDGYCSAASMCNVTILDPDNTAVVSSGEMTNQIAFHNYTLQNANVTKLGTYQVSGFCKDGVYSKEIDFEFDITKTGFVFSQGKATIYVGLLALLVLMFVGALGVTFFLPSGNNRDEEGTIISINQLKHLRPILYMVAWGLLIAITFTSANIALAYLDATMFGDLLFKLYSILMALSLPLFTMGLIWIFVSIFQDKQFKAMIERGVPVGETP